MEGPALSPVLVGQVASLLKDNLMLSPPCCKRKGLEQMQTRGRGSQACHSQMPFLEVGH